MRRAGGPRRRYCAAILLHCAAASCSSEAIGIFAAAVGQACFALSARSTAEHASNQITTSNANVSTALDGVIASRHCSCCTSGDEAYRPRDM